jgi:DNA-binding response OmpR family regulator
LILVDEGDSPPVIADAFEDWIRLPATPGDIESRVGVLADRAQSITSGPRPTLDAEGVLAFADRVVPLSPIASSLAAVLIDRFQRVVPRHALAHAAWPDDDPKLNALDVHLVRLRRQVARVGLTVRTVRQRGYLLDEERPQRRDDQR